MTWICESIREKFEDHLNKEINFCIVDYFCLVNSKYLRRFQKIALKNELNNIIKEIFKIQKDEITIFFFTKTNNYSNFYHRNLMTILFINSRNFFNDINYYNDIWEKIGMISDINEENYYNFIEKQKQTAIFKEELFKKVWNNPQIIDLNK